MSGRDHANLGAQFGAFATNDIPINRDKPTQNLPLQLKIPIFPPAATQSDWDLLSMNVSAAVGPSGEISTLQYSPGKVYDNKGPLDKDTFTENNSTYITITTDTSNPLLNTLVMLGDQYANWSIDPRMKLGVQFMNVNASCAVEWSATAKGWRNTLVTGQGIVGQADLYGTLSAEDPSTCIDFSRVNPYAFKQMSCHSVAQSTGAQVAEATRCAHNEREDGPMFYFVLSGLKMTYIEYPKNKPIGYIILDMNIRFWGWTPSIALNNYLAWKDSGYSVSGSTPEPDTKTHTGFSVNQKYAYGTMKETAVEGQRILLKQQPGVKCARNAQVSFRLPKEKIWYESGAVKHALKKALEDLPPALRKSASNIVSSHSIFGSMDGDPDFAVSSDKYVEHVKSAYTTEGGPTNMDVVMAYAADGNEVFSVAGGDYGCATPPACGSGSILGNITVDSSVTEKNVTGFSSAFIPNDSNAMCIVNAKGEVVADSTDTVVGYMPFILKDGSFDPDDPEVTNLRPSFYFTHVYTVPSQGVSRDSETLIGGVDVGSKVVAADAVVAPCSHPSDEIPDAVLNSILVDLPEAVKNSSDKAFVKQYIEAARKEKCRSLGINWGGIVSGFANVATSFFSKEKGKGVGAPYGRTNVLANAPGGANRLKAGKNALRDSEDDNNFMGEEDGLHDTLPSGEVIDTKNSFIRVRSTQGLASVKEDASEVTFLVNGIFKNWLAARYVVNKDNADEGQYARCSIKFSFAADGTVFMTNMCGVAKVSDGATDGKFVWQEFSGNASLPLIQASIPHVVCSVYPVILASSLPPSDERCYMYSVIINSPQDSYMEVSPINIDATDKTQQVFLQVTDTASGSKVNIPVTSCPFDTSTYFEQDQLVPIPASLPDPNNNGALKAVGLGDKIYLYCALYTQVRSDIPYAVAKEQYSSSTSYEVKYWNGASTQTMTPISYFKGGYLVGISVGNNGVLYSDGTLDTSQKLTETFSVNDFSFNYEVCTPVNYMAEGN